MYKVVDKLIPLGHPNRSGKKLTKKKALVYHYTGNYKKGADAEANAEYFRRKYIKDKSSGIVTEMNGKQFVYASAHYNVDEAIVTINIPDDEVAYHVGAKSYTEFAKKNFTTPNYETIGIEMCVNEGNDWHKTMDNAIDLGADIIIKYGISMDMVIRHYDVTGKVCPAMFVDMTTTAIDPDWLTFKARLENRVKEKRKLMNETGNKPSDTVKYPFNDIANHPYRDFIIEVADLFTGDNKGNFNPDRNLTRGEFAVILARLTRKEK